MSSVRLWSHVPLLLLAGCFAPPPVYIVQAEPELVCVDQQPPEPRLEVSGPAPDASSQWQPGYWAFNDGEYSWVDGQWTEPRPGYEYVEPYYGLVDGSWWYRPPYWAPRGWAGRHGRHKRPHRGRHEVPRVAQGPVDVDEATLQALVQGAAIHPDGAWRLRQGLSAALTRGLVSRGVLGAGG